MNLCDTGVIVAVINKRDQDHALCVEALKSVRVKLITTWPCLTEAMYLLGAHGGRAEQEVLRLQLERGLLDVAAPAKSDALRACILMRQYADIPMDFADASLVAAAEALNIPRILTLDRHFYAYRLFGNTPFQVIPPR